MNAAEGGDGQRLELSHHKGNKYIIILEAKRILSCYMLNINRDVSFSSSADTRFGRVCLKQIQFQTKFNENQCRSGHVVQVPSALTLKPAPLPQPSAFPEGKFI